MSFHGEVLGNKIRSSNHDLVMAGVVGVGASETNKAEVAVIVFQRSLLD